MALRVADQKIHVGHRCRKGGQVVEVLLVLELLDVQIPPALQLAGGQLAHHAGLGRQLLLPLAPGVIVAEREEGRAQ